MCCPCHVIRCQIDLAFCRACSAIIRTGSSLLFSSSIDPVSTSEVPRFRPLSLLRLPIAFRLGHDFIRRRKLARVLRLSFKASLFEACGVDGC